MELRHLEYFVTVARERSFTRAARHLQVVQSGVSTVIKALERELGVQLLDRDSKHVELTDAGIALLPKAAAALSAAREARDAVAEAEGKIRGTLRIGIISTVPRFDIAELIGDYHRRHPEVAIRLVAVSTGSAGLVAATVDGQLDLAFVSMPLPAPSGIRLRELATGSLVLVVPAGHRLAGRAAVDLPDFADEPLIDFPVGYGTRAVTDRAFSVAGLDRQVSIEITNGAIGAAYVRHGLGVALLPDFVAPSGEDFARLPVTGADLRWSFALATPETRRGGAAARALLKLVEQRLTDVPGGNAPTGP